MDENETLNEEITNEEISFEDLAPLMYIQTKILCNSYKISKGFFLGMKK